MQRFVQKDIISVRFTRNQFILITGESFFPVCLGQARNNAYNKMLPTYRPNKRRRAKHIGFRARMATAGGRKVLSARRAKGRHELIRA